jgi:hypothetical protein
VSTPTSSIITARVPAQDAEQFRRLVGRLGITRSQAVAALIRDSLTSGNETRGADHLVPMPVSRAGEPVAHS